MHKTRVACDTGILFSALFFGGNPGKILEAVKQNRATLFMSEYIRDELRQVIISKGLSTSALDALLSLDNVRIITDRAYDTAENFNLAKEFVPDAKDRPVYAFFLELARKNACDVLVSSDKHLLQTNPKSPLYNKILTPAQLIEREEI